MRSLRKGRNPHQSVAPQDPQTIAPLDGGTVALSMIQALIPLGLKAVEDALQQEVMVLAGARYARADEKVGVARWGSQPGSIFLADQKLPITVPRVRDVHAGTELPLATYAQFMRSCKRHAPAMSGCSVACWAGCRVASTKRRRKPCPKRSGSPSRVCRGASLARVRTRSANFMSDGMMIGSGSCCCSTASPSRPIKS